MECDSDLSEVECTQSGLDADYGSPPTPGPSSEGDDEESTSQSVKSLSEEDFTYWLVCASDLNSSDEDEQHRGKSPVPTQCVHQRKRRSAEEVDEARALDLSFPKKRYEPCREDGNSHSDGGGSELFPEKRCEPYSDDRNSDLNVHQSLGANETTSQKKKKKTGKQKKTEEENVLEKPVLKVRRPWSDAEKSAVEKHLANFIAERRVPRKDPCLRCQKKESALDGRTWKDIKNFVSNRIVTLHCRSAKKKLAL